MTLTMHHADAPPARSWRQAIWRGMRHKCPNCGKGNMFRAFLKVADTCGHCGEELHHHQADDAPPYFTIFIVGHIVVPLVLLVEKLIYPPVWVHMAIWLPLTVVLALLFLPPVKGALVAYQWALRMHGFEHAGRGSGESASPAS